ncbi:hypothetical protein [Haloarchaeobius litoreus]|uniref:Uncharacterized protein n=1 Tax=Haloarchaeobius litoreus TaxID=755306 RepID=A0ABD6DKU2_9EURY|nr:hypothetical protein [Haloarchaeobius litoreus]
MTESPPTDADETYREDHPVDYCPSCNTKQDVYGIYRTDLGHTSVARTTEEATGNRCERCGHTWINIHRPDPDDYPNANLDDFARTKPTGVGEKSFTLLAQKASRAGLTILRGALWGCLTVCLVLALFFEGILQKVDPEGVTKDAN